MSPVSARPRRRGNPIHSRGRGGATGVAGRARPLGGPPRPGQDLHLLLCALRAAGRFPRWAPAAEQPANLGTDSDRLGLKKTGRPRRGPCLGARCCPRPTRLPPAPAPAPVRPRPGAWYWCPRRPGAGDGPRAIGACRGDTPGVPAASLPSW